MKSTGVVRNLDELGRVVIPKEIRHKFDILERDPLEIYVSGNTIVLKKAEQSCVFCNSSKDLKEYENKLICSKCVQNICKM